MPDLGGIHPSLIYFAGALLVALAPAKPRKWVALGVAVLGFGAALGLSESAGPYTARLLNFDLVLMRVDAWSAIFANIFCLLSVIGVLYILHENSRLQFSAGLLYAGAAVGVALSGDLITLFVFWEILTLGAVMCLITRRTVASGRAACRYFVIHALGGVILMAGIVLHVAETGSTAFSDIGLSGLGSYLIFIGIGVNCAWPVLGAWLTDTYPEASIGGVVFMATYTTKTAVYVLARTFPGEETLVWVGMAMATIPIFYAVIENDLRRVLAYSLINQVGFMVVGVGLGTGLSLNGTAAHAYCHILYKALLFMSIGAVMFRTGKSKATELGGLYRSMPLTCIFCCIGAASISAFPLFSGFVSKSMIMSAAAKEGFVVVWMALLFASAGVFHHAGIKIPFFAFFSHDSGIRCKEAPRNMLIAMGIAAFLCIFVGSFPNAFLYGMLPDQSPKAAYEPYTVGHVTDQLSLLLFSALAFTLLMRAGLYPAEIRSVNLDFDWLYRKGGRAFYGVTDRVLNGTNRLVHAVFVRGFIPSLSRFFTEAPARLLCWMMVPVWVGSGLTPEQIASKREVMYVRAQRGVFPVGVTVCLAVLLLAFLFLF
ncbi:MAG: Na(+)/H(+) antiporter subunit D [Verrucomicrobiota bacterium]